MDELRQKTEQELRNLLVKQRKELQNIVSDLLQKKEKNINKARLARVEIARMQTVISEKRNASTEESK